MAQASSKHCRLLDLPAEMRVQIYEYAFGDNGPEEVDVFQLRSLLPQLALTAVSRLVRRESYSSWETVYQRFWRNHSLCSKLSGNVPIDLELEFSQRRTKVLTRMRKLPLLKESATVRVRRGQLLGDTPLTSGCSMVVTQSGTGDIVMHVEPAAESRLQASARGPEKISASCAPGTSMSLQNSAAGGL